ncbi:MAG: GGDEF domain-containing protein [Lachnospiraceae bacterium]|nr:GGDEF domain-containing protein [Lachnospiraceae bacterium]
MEKIFQIGVLIGNVHTQHPMELIRGICEAAKGENVNITFFVGVQGNALDFWSRDVDENDLSSYNYQYNSLYDYSLIAGLDAIIISYGTLCIYLDRDNREEFVSKFRSVPLVILEEYDEEATDSFLISDNYGSMYMIVEHLVSVHQYKKILYLSGPKNNTDSNEREHAYRDVMQKYGLQIEAGMVEYGDYSAEVDELVERLLDHNPDAEAIVCANDEMASSVYCVCKKRGIRPGSDLAVTGYDDVDFAKRMDPPLTTANQDGLDMGFRALKCAVSLCRDPRPVKMKLPARFLQRQSCGCRDRHSDAAGGLEAVLNRIEGAEDAEGIRAAVFNAAESSFQSIASDQSLDHGREYFSIMIEMLIRQIVDGNLTEKEMTDRALAQIQALCEKEGAVALEFTGFTSCFHELILFFMQKTEDHELILRFEKVLQVTDNYVTAYLMRSSEERITMLLKRSWTAPATIQYMIEKVDDENAFHRLALENTISQGAKSAYLYLAPEPIRYDRNKNFSCPEKLELAAEYSDGTMKLYDLGNRPIVTQKDGLSSHYPSTPEHTYVAFMLFAKAFQYGIMLCEIEASSIGLLYGVALQISTAKAYMQISRQENEAKQQLYETLKELSDKNKVLGFISETDALTGLYNRRGFMERAMKEVVAHAGSRAVLFFSDLDHLKQINDDFGHTDGDFALENASAILKETVCSFREDGTVCGRIGGDEFISLMICETDRDAEAVMERLKEKIREFNEHCDKPYYVEFSTGCHLFTCSENYSVAELAGESDAALYEAKKKRRVSIVKADDRAHDDQLLRSRG